MADNAAKALKMARLLALAHIIVGVLLFIFGIVDRVHGYFWSGEGCFGIWCGIWMCITGGLGIPASSRERNSSTNAMAGAFMGFSITSSVFGGVTIICYSISISSYHYWHYGWGYHYYSEYHSEMAITSIILILGIIEFGIGIWAADVCCTLNSCNCCTTPSDQMTSVVYVTGQGVVSGGYVLGQGPGGVPAAIPVQQPGGVVTVPGVHPQMVHMPAAGMVHVAGQPQMYQMSPAWASGGQPQMVPTSGAKVVTAPPSGAVGSHVLSSGGVPGAVGGQPQFVRVTPEGVMAGQGNQQGPPPYNPDEQLPFKTG